MVRMRQLYSFFGRSITIDSVYQYCLPAETVTCKSYTTIAMIGYKVSLQANDPRVIYMGTV